MIRNLQQDTTHPKLSKQLLLRLRDSEFCNRILDPRQAYRAESFLLCPDLLSRFEYVGSGGPPIFNYLKFLKWILNIPPGAVDFSNYETGYFKTAPVFNGRHIDYLYTSIPHTDLNLVSIDTMDAQVQPPSICKYIADLCIRTTGVDILPIISKAVIVVKIGGVYHAQVAIWSKNKGWIYYLDDIFSGKSALVLNSSNIYNVFAKIVTVIFTISNENLLWITQPQPAAIEQLSFIPLAEGYNEISAEIDNEQYRPPTRIRRNPYANTDEPQMVTVEREPLPPPQTPPLSPSTAEAKLLKMWADEDEEDELEPFVEPFPLEP